MYKKLKTQNIIDYIKNLNKKLLEPGSYTETAKLQIN